jgi:hypothetical protein
VPALWGLRALARLITPDKPDDEIRIEGGASGLSGTARPPWWWAAVLLALCTLELLTHTGEQNGWVASSRPTSGVETWTTADGYAILFDGIPAQGDGLALLPMLSLFAGDAPPRPSEFDRRAGHVYLVSLLQRPLGLYWSFAAVNLVSWWIAALAVWWLGRRRWPESSVPWLASAFVATGQGFTFVAAAPQAHGVALASFAAVLALAEALRVWQAPSARSGLGNWAKLGWAVGAAGLIYLANVPALIFLWLYAAARAPRRAMLLRWLAGVATASLVALAIVAAWQVYASALLGLSFAGGNNDLVGEAARGWISDVRRGMMYVVGQLHADSPRGILGAAFYYPWWLLAVIGYAASDRENRRWTLAIILAASLPTIAFSTRFGLPRVAYFMFPAVYLLAARGVEIAAIRLLNPLRATVAAPHTLREAFRPAPLAVAGALALGLILMGNVDLLGNQQLNLWFHYSQGNGW